MIENVRMLNGLSRSWKLLALKFEKSPNEMRNAVSYTHLPYLYSKV